MSELIDIKKASEMLGVNVKTLRRWDNEGKLNAYRTIGGHRRYKIKDIELLIGGELNNIEDSNNKKVFIYCRVSTRKQAESGNLVRQKERLVEYCKENKYDVVEIFEEVASGINDKRKELNKMFKRLNEVDCIIIEYPDRLARFGFNYLKEFCNAFNVDLIMLEQNEQLEPNEEMVNDLISIVTCFSARIYGARGGKKVRADIQKSLEEIERVNAIEDNNKSTLDK